MLDLKGVARYFGGVRAVDGLELTVGDGEIVALIGPNGSGKSTTVNLIAGVFPLSAGAIYFRGEDIGGLPTHRRLQAGIARTFQNIRLFGQLTVWQNLWVAQNALEDRARRGFFARWLGGRARAREEIFQLLEFSALAHKQDELAANLAFGEQRRLELARALASKPKLLLLDEPAAGMNSEEIGQLRERILSLRQRGVTILLIEHVMELVMGVADRIAVLNFGQKIAEGAPAEIQADAAVRRAYLGGEA
ncbi:MAG: ABC transporter ATP-binding protein [Betaproteobacteria bacterium]|nr:MAG: ABC transporter ATP-binding protein [Betaproteobacteria bacterium]